MVEMNKLDTSIFYRIVLCFMKKGKVRLTTGKVVSFEKNRETHTVRYTGDLSQQEKQEVFQLAIMLG